MYTPRFVDASTAASWFAELRREVAWRAERRMMYDREVEVPRLIGHYALDPAPDATPAAILDAACRVTDSLAVPLHGVPKTTEAVGERISLAFLMKRRRGAAADDDGIGMYR